MELAIYWPVFSTVPSIKLDIYWFVLATVHSMELAIYWKVLVTVTRMELATRVIQELMTMNFFSGKVLLYSDLFIMPHGDTDITYPCLKCGAFIIARIDAMII